MLSVHPTHRFGLVLAGTSRRRSSPSTMKRSWVVLCYLGLGGGCDASLDDIRKWRESKNASKLVSAALSEKDDVQRAAIDALVNIGQPSVEPLIDTLKNNSGFGNDETAASILVRIGAPSAAALIKITEDRAFNQPKPIPRNGRIDKEAHRHAVLELTARTLARIGASLVDDDPRKAAELLIRALRDGNRETQAKATPFLVALDEDQGFQVLARIADRVGNLDDVRRRWLAPLPSWTWFSRSSELDVWAIEQVVRRDFAVDAGQVDRLKASGLIAAKAAASGSPDAVAEIPYAIRLFSDGTPLAWWAPGCSDRPTTPAGEASDWLVRVGRPAVVPLIRSLEIKDDEVRWLAARTLGEIRDRRAVGPLLGLLRDRSDRVRRCAAEMLGGSATSEPSSP